MRDREHFHGFDIRDLSLMTIFQRSGALSLILGVFAQERMLQVEAVLKRVPNVVKRIGYLRLVASIAPSSKVLVRADNRIRNDVSAAVTSYVSHEASVDVMIVRVLIGNSRKGKLLTLRIIHYVLAISTYIVEPSLVRENDGYLCAPRAHDFRSITVF